jgi:hypothetical protein
MRVRVGKVWDWIIHQGLRRQAPDGESEGETGVIYPQSQGYTDSTSSESGLFCMVVSGQIASGRRKPLFVVKKVAQRQIERLDRERSRRIT